MLSLKQIENAKPGAERYELPDERGLYLIVQPSGLKSWALRYRYAGKTRKLTLGNFPTLQPADKIGKDERGRKVVLAAGARTLAVQARQAVMEGRDPGAEKIAARAAGDQDSNLYPAAAERFILKYAKPKNRSWEQTARRLGLRPDKADDAKLVPIAGGLAERWAARRVQDIAKRDILDVLDGVADDAGGLAANRTLAAVRKFFGWLVERDVLPMSPCAGVKPPAEETRRDRILTDDEIRWLWKAAADVPQYGEFAKLLLLTGQRRNEVAGMNAAELDMARKLWVIPGERVKNGDTHSVPLSDLAVSIIEAAPKIKNGPGYVFPATAKTPITAFSAGKIEIDKAMLKFAKQDKGAKAAIERWTFHDLRRTVASGMARLGVALPVIEKVLNHKSGSFAGVVGVYQRHGYDAEKRDALDRWALFVSGLVSPAGDKVVKLRA